MKTLELPFVRGGFNHELISREGMVCLVKRSKPHNWHYEVVKLQREPDKIIVGRPCPEHERDPASEEWGTNGFTYMASQLRRAQERWRSLILARLSPR